MEEPDYTRIKEAVEAAGFYAAIQKNPIGNPEVWIVLASRFTEGRFHGNVFRLVLKAGRCYLVTWSTVFCLVPPVFYLVPPGTDLIALSLDCLRESTSPNPELPPEIADRYQVLEVSEEDYNRA